MELDSYLLSLNETFNGSHSLNLTEPSHVYNPGADTPKSLDFRLRIIQLIVQPIIGILGLTGNGLTFLMLSRCSLRKPSNLIIFGLTVADSMTLLKSVDVFYLLGRFGHSVEGTTTFGWEYPESIARVMCIMYRLMTVLELWGGFAGASLPVVITLERLIAVYCPLKFKTFVTTNRAAFIVCSVWLFWAPDIIFFLFVKEFRYAVSQSGQFLGYEVPTELYSRNSEIINFFNRYFFNFLSSIFPVTLVCIGCVLIAIKIRSSQRQRSLISSSKKTSSLRTTRTLVAISLVFAVVNAGYFVITIFTMTVFKNDQLMTNFLGEVKMTLIYLGSSCNFLFYICLNSRFRKILIGIFHDIFHIHKTDPSSLPE